MTVFLGGSESPNPTPGAIAPSQFSNRKNARRMPPCYRETLERFKIDFARSRAGKNTQHFSQTASIRTDRTFFGAASQGRTVRLPKC
jgi:hypothetical protein